ncbi:MAG: SurA N-terminal domain-containing protein [Candidatus Paceibacterota bacterium]
MNQKTISLAIGSIAVLAVIAFAIFGDLEGLEQIQNGGGENVAAVALVNGEEISGAEFDARLTQTEALLAQQGQSAQLEDPTVRAQLEEQVLNQLVSETLLLQGAEAAGMSASPEEIDQRIASLVQQVGGQEVFESQLEQQGVSEAEIRADLESQIAIQKYLEANVDTSDIQITDQEVSAFYEQISAQQEGLPPLEQIEGQIRAQLTQQQQGQLINVFTEELRQDAEIEILI